MGVIRFLRAHVDAVTAVLLSGAYLAEAALASERTLGGSFIAGLETDERLAVTASVVFLASLGLRVRLPLLPLGLALIALTLAGRAAVDASYILLAGLVLASYSAGAWASGLSGQVGALGVGILAGLAVIRAAGETFEPRSLAVPLFILVGAWLAGLAARTIRVERGDERVIGPISSSVSSAAPDSAGRDETARELRDVIERSMSAVILQARAARGSLEREPGRARRALSVIEAAGSEALEESQRLVGLLLSPDGAPLPEPQPGLADLDYLALQVSEAGLPVDTRVEGQPLPLTPDLDAVAYRVVHEALMSTLNHSRDAQSSVVVRYARDELQVEVTDDGLSVEDADDLVETAGLVAVRKDVAALGGTLDAGPGEGRGYWVLARLPYEPDWG